MASFKRLVRFTYGGQTHYGDLVDSAGNGYKVRRLTGNPFKTLESTNDIIQIQELLCPIERTPLIVCIGLNYQSHAQEAKLPLPKSPAVFTKPPDALAGPSDEVQCHPDTQKMLDFEGELVIILGKDAKNVSEANAMEYVLGFSAGNDVSARNFQLPEVSGGQFCYAKSFDGFAPIGHTITAPSEVQDPLAVRITTKVNGVLKQDSNTSGMVFSVGRIISFLSRGTALRKGTLIMTGTRSGIGFFQGEFLQDGDVVEVEVHGIGKVSNRIVLLAE